MKNPFRRAANAAGTPSSHASTDATHELDLAAADEPRRRRNRIVPIAAAAAALALVGTGAAVAASAHKTVTLDVDGQITEVTTWRGSVEKLLAEQEIVVGERDVVAPSPAAALRDGAEVVVRYGREVTISDDGELTDIWTTAVDADEVLATLAARGDDAHLVASRSAERTEIGIRLPTDGTVNVSVDGEVLEVPAGPEDIDGILAEAEVDLEELDRVSVQRLDSDGEAAADGVVTVVVNRVVVEERTKTKTIEHESETVTDANRFSDLGTAVQTEGKDGERTIVHRVTLVDGEVEESEKLSDEVTTEPVTEVLVKGTKARPVVVAQPKATSSGSSSGSSSSGSSSTKSQGAAPTEGVWAKLAQCESGGNPSIVSSNGLYHGLYQFSVSTWKSVGGSGLPSQASAAEQTQRAQALQARSGWGQWPHCSSKLGLR